MKPTFFTAGNKTVEMRDRINGTTGGPYIYYRLIQLQLGEVAKGSLIDVVASCQISFAKNYLLMVGSAIRLHEDKGKSYERSLGAWKPGQEICEANGTNIDSDVHHLPILRTDKRIVTRNYSNAYVTFIVYAAGRDYRSGDLIKVDQDYGSMSALLHPPDSFIAAP